jgi:hypothetical protein
MEFGLGLLAVILGAIASAATATGLPWLAGFGIWVAVVTTAGAAVSTHLAAARYEYTAISYTSMANRLGSLRDTWLADPDRYQPDRVGKLVDDCENAISSENEVWLTEWTRKESTTGQSVASSVSATP